MPSLSLVPTAVAVLFGLIAAVAAAGESASPPAEDRPPLTLREAARRTLAANPELSIHAERLRAQMARVDAAALRPVTELSAEFENFAGSGRRRGVDALESTLSLSRLIEPEGRRGKRIDVEQASLAVMSIEQRIAQLDLLAELARRYIHVAADENELVLTGAATALAERTVGDAERRVEQARAPALELGRARIALARARVEQEHAEHELLTSRRKLAAMWGAREPDFGSLQVDLHALPEVADYDALVERLARSPDFLRYASQARQRDADVRLAEAHARAPLTVSAGLRRYEDGGDTALVAGISLPLFAGAQAAPQIAQARAARALVDGERTAAQLRAETRLFELVQELRHANTEAQVLRDEVLPQMRAVVEAAADGWRRGRYSYLEWSEVQREHVEVQRALIEAVEKAQTLRIEIERLSGLPVSDPDALEEGTQP